jgi:methionine-rich copper-binding protein CopC
MTHPRLLFTAALTAGLVALTAAPAAAHVDLDSTSPKRNATVSRSISTVALTFSGPLRRGTVRVTGPGGRIVSVGRGGRDPRSIRRLRVELRRGLRRGAYRVRWALLAADGHKQSGSYRFRVR